MKTEQTPIYQAPEITVVEIESESLLATSGTTATTEDMNEESGNW